MHCARPAPIKRSSSTGHDRRRERLVSGSHPHPHFDSAARHLHHVLHPSTTEHAVGDRKEQRTMGLEISTLFMAMSLCACCTMPGGPRATSETPAPTATRRALAFDSDRS